MEAAALAKALPLAASAPYKHSSPHESDETNMLGLRLSSVAAVAVACALLFAQDAVAAVRLVCGRSPLACRYRLVPPIYTTLVTFLCSCRIWTAAKFAHT